MRTEPTDIPRTTEPNCRAWAQDQERNRKRRPKPTQEPTPAQWPKEQKESKR